MICKLNEVELRRLAYGATFLGSGGGGKLDAGLKMIERMMDQGYETVELAEASDMGDSYAVPVALIGSAADLDVDEDFRKHITAAGETMRESLKAENKKVEYIISGEQGGENTLVAAYAAASLGMPLIDADCQGRAVPELGTSLLAIYNIPTTPLVMTAGDEEVDIIVTTPADPHNADILEKLARSVCVAYGGTAAFSTWPVNREDIENKLITGEMRKSMEVGKVILDSQANKLDVVEELKANIDCKLLARGTVKEVELEVGGGFEMGIVTVAGEPGDCKIYFKNESLMARNEKGEIVAVAPDLISMMDVKNCRPLTNAEIEEGMEVAYFIMEADNQWKKSQQALDVWEPILEVMRKR